MLAATLSPSWGVYSGLELAENEPASPDNEEYLNSEKYELKQRDWTRADSLMGLFSRLNAVRRAHPAMWRLGSLRFHHVDNDQVIAYSYHRGLDGAEPDTVVVVVNLDPYDVQEATVYLDAGVLGLPGNFEVTDQLTDETYSWHEWGNYVRLDPAERPGHVLVVHRR